MQESEVRAIIKDHIGFVKILSDNGIFPTKETFIEDLFFDTPNEDLKWRGEKLRLRSIGEKSKKNLLCWKGKKSFRNGVKSREEIEFQVGYSHDAIAFLERLGFIRNKVIKRKAWHFVLGQTKVRLEFFPEENGWMAEIEGSLEGINQAKALFPSIHFGPFPLNRLLKKLKE